MATQHGIQWVVSLDNSGGTPVDLSAYIEDVSLPESVDLAEVSTIADTGKKFVPGLEDATVTISYVFDSVIALQLNSLKRLAATTTFDASPDNGTTNFTGECRLGSVDRAGGIGSAVKGSATFQVDGVVAYS